MRDPDKLVIGFALSMALASLAAIFLQPSHIVDSAPGMLSELIPNRLKMWNQSMSGLQQVSLFAVDENGANPMDEVYDDSLLRTYIDSNGHQMMVAMAYDHVQREEDRVHRPEICYIAQGFSILSDQSVAFDFESESGDPVIGRRMLTRQGNRYEAVSYWIRVGDSFTENPWKSRLYVIQEGLAGRLHDGILVRVSEVIRNSSEAPASFARQQSFLVSLLESVSSPAAHFIARRDLHQRAS